MQRINLLKKSHNGPKIPKKLTIEHISGHLNILIWGLAIAVIAFFVEIIYHKKFATKK